MNFSEVASFFLISFLRFLLLFALIACELISKSVRVPGKPKKFVGFFPRDEKHLEAPALVVAKAPSWLGARCVCTVPAQGRAPHPGAVRSWSPALLQAAPGHCSCGHGSGDSALSETFSTEIYPKSVNC